MEIIHRYLPVFTQVSRGVQTLSARRRAEVSSPSSAPLEWDTAAFNRNVTAAAGTSVRWVLELRARGFHPRVDWFGPPDGNKIESDRVRS